jgi:hypothetical protein
VLKSKKQKAKSTAQGDSELLAKRPALNALLLLTLGEVTSVVLVMRSANSFNDDH